MRRFLIALLFFPLLVSKCYALEAADIFGVGEAEAILPSDVRETAGGLEADGSYDTHSAVIRLAKKAVNTLRDEWRGNIELIVSMLSVAFASALALALCENSTIKYYVNLIGVCSEALILLGGMDGLIRSIVDTMRRLSDYAKIAFPTVFTAAAISGAAVSAPAKYGVVCLGLEILMDAAEKFIIPLVYAYIALSLSESIYKNAVTEAVKRFSKWAAVTLMTAITLSFSLILSVSGAISGSADALAVKTVRTVISGALPVIGGIASDAASAVLSAASMIRASAGALGMAAVCAFCIGPFAKLLVRSLAFKAGSALCSSFAGGSIDMFLNDMGNASAMLMGLTGCECIMLFISFTSAIKAVTSV